MSLDSAIDALAPRAFDVLAALVEQRSTVGVEQGALEVLGGELTALGFDVSRLPIPADIGEDPAAGIPRMSYEGRYDIVAQRGPESAARTLLINGHMDTVPADDVSAWTSPPFVPTIRDGWMFGRGAGDMKGGFAAGLLALWALDQETPGWLGDGALSFVAAIEEEYTGNGTLAAARDGHLAEAVLLLEPTELDLLLAGIGIVWVTIEVDGRSGHAEAAGRSVNPIIAARPVVAALEAFEARLNAEHVAATPGAGSGGTAGSTADAVFAGLAHPYNLNIGEFHAGDWASSVPFRATLEVRVGHPGGWTSEQALAEVQAAVLAGCADDEWLAAHPPRFRLSGFRAERFAQEPRGDLVDTLVDAHRNAHTYLPQFLAMGSTTDARIYLNQFGIPAVAYGPKTRNMHGVDEAVELQSIVDTARTVARFLTTWFGGVGGEGE